MTRGRHRHRPTAAVRLAQAGMATTVFLAAIGVVWLGRDDTSRAVPVAGNFTTQAQPYDIPAPPTGQPPTTAVTSTEPATAAARTRARTSDRVNLPKRRGVVQESAPMTSLKSERAPRGAASTTTSSAPPKTTAPPVTIQPASSAPRAPGSSCSLHDITGGAVGWVERAASYIADRTGFDGRMLGKAGRAGNSTSDHPGGYAVDFMGADDELAEFALNHRDELGVAYVIYRQRYNDGSGWDPMEDRGSPTANHFDHVHVSFRRTAPDSATLHC